MDRLPEEDPADKILSKSEELEDAEELYAYLVLVSGGSLSGGYMDVTGLKSARTLVMAKRKTNEYYRILEAAMRCSGLCSHT